MVGHYCLEMKKITDEIFFHDFKERNRKKKKKIKDRKKNSFGVFLKCGGLVGICGGIFFLTKKIGYLKNIEKL